MVMRGWGVEAAATVTTFAPLLRPSEVPKIRAIDLVPPVGNLGRRRCEAWCCTQKASKVGDQDETSLVDGLEFDCFGKILRRPRRALAPCPSERTLALEYARCAARFRDLAMATGAFDAGYPALSCAMGRLRIEALVRRRSAADLIRRGRWNSEIRKEASDDTAKMAAPTRCSR